MSGREARVCGLWEGSAARIDQEGVFRDAWISARVRGPEMVGRAVE